MKCSQVRKMIFPYVDQELAPPEKTAFTVLKNNEKMSMCVSQCKTRNTRRRLVMRTIAVLIILLVSLQEVSLRKRISRKEILRLHQAEKIPIPPSPIGWAAPLSI